MLLRQAIPIEINLTIDIKSFDLFSNKFHRWVHSSEQKVMGLPSGNPVIVSGITDAFNQLYGLYNKIGLFDGEYGYHELALGDRVTTNLQEADCIVVSHPFSADGMSSEALLHLADSYNKPIFIDCAFFGICNNISFNFSNLKNVHSVCFSLSKTFGTGLNRVGLLYTQDNFPAKIYREWNYPLISQAISHYNLIDTLSPDDMFRKYRSKQLEICAELDVAPSDTVIFGYDCSDKYKEYRRGQVNRLCISALLNTKLQEVLK
tara:strand:+ start:235 stop:1020 length:786 start_codon:yes stop_codon:yes gene_type:complete